MLSALGLLIAAPDYAIIQSIAVMALIAHEHPYVCDQRHTLA